MALKGPKKTLAIVGLGVVVVGAGIFAVLSVRELIRVGEKAIYDSANKRSIASTATDAGGRAGANPGTVVTR